MLILNISDLVQFIDAKIKALDNKGSFEADDDLYTSPSFLDSTEGLMIFFGSKNLNNNSVLMGGYKVVDHDDYNATILATGSEVENPAGHSFRMI